MTKSKKKKKPPRSLAELSTLDDFLKEQGTFEEFQEIVIKEALALADRRGADASLPGSTRQSIPSQESSEE
jgi:hypothetical protein